MNHLWKKNAAFALALALTVCTVSPNAAGFLTAAAEMPDAVSLPSEASAEGTGDNTSVESITDISDAIVKLDADNKVAAVKINGENKDPGLFDIRYGSSYDTAGEEVPTKHGLYRAYVTGKEGSGYTGMAVSRDFSISFYSEEYDINFMTAWTSTDSLPEKYGQYYLTEDIVLDEADVGTFPEEICIYLNDHSITYTGEGPLMTLKESFCFPTIIGGPSTEGNANKIRITNPDGRLVDVTGYHTLMELYGVTVEAAGEAARLSGVQAARLYLKDGSRIICTDPDSDAWAISTKGSSYVEMDGGTITGYKNAVSACSDWVSISVSGDSVIDGTIRLNSTEVESVIYFSNNALLSGDHIIDLVKWDEEKGWVSNPPGTGLSYAFTYGNTDSEFTLSEALSGYELVKNSGGRWLASSPDRDIHAGTKWLIGEPCDLGLYYYIADDLTGEPLLCCGETTTVEKPEYIGEDGAWKFPGIFYFLNQETGKYALRYLRIAGTPDQIPTGFEITGGSGTQEDPFTFGLVLDDRIPLNNAEITLDPAHHVTSVTLDGKTVEPSAYEVTYGTDPKHMQADCPTAPGTFYAFVTAKPDNETYAGSAASEAFSVVYDLSEAAVSINPLAARAEVTINGMEVSEEDYVLTFGTEKDPAKASAELSTEPGEYYAFITPVENSDKYTGTKITAFTMPELVTYTYYLYDESSKNWASATIDIFEVTESGDVWVNEFGYQEGDEPGGSLFLERGKTYRFIWRKGAYILGASLKLWNQSGRLINARDIYYNDNELIAEVTVPVQDVLGDLSGAEITMYEDSALVSSVVLDGKQLEQYKDYDVTYKSGDTVTETPPVAPGDYTVILTGIHEYKGSIEQPLTLSTHHQRYNFESGTDGWTFIDFDHDGIGWMHGSEWKEIESYPAEMEDVTIHSVPYESFIVSESFRSGSDLIVADNWAVSPAGVVVSDGKAELSLWARSMYSEMPDHFQIYAAKTSDADCDLFDPAEWTAVSEVIEAPKEYTRFTVDLSAFAGEEIYIAIRHHDTYNYSLMIDDIQLPFDQAASDKATADKVAAMIESIGDITKTPECEQTVRSVREAYDLLTEAQKNLVYNYTDLLDAEAELTYFAPVDALCEMAIKDYEVQNGITPANAEAQKNADGTLSIKLTDENGKLIDTYKIDPVTATGIDTDKTNVNLPQTGMSGFHKVFAALAALMGITGVGLVKKSRKEDEE